jgi:hypothetical protein
MLGKGWHRPRRNTPVDGLCSDLGAFRGGVGETQLTLVPMPRGVRRLLQPRPVISMSKILKFAISDFDFQ